MTMPFQTIPEGLDEITTMTGTTIRKRWFTWMILPLLIFAAAWDSFIIFWYSMALSHAAIPLIAVLFPLGHVAVGVFLTYFVAASFVNKTDVIIDTSSVEVKTGPFPWPGNKRLMAADIVGLMVRERSGNRNGNKTYSVMYASHDRKEKKLVASLANKDQADFIASKIREIAGLPAGTAS